MDGKIIAIGAGIVGAIGALIYFASRVKAVPPIALSAGWNDVTYTGKKQIAGVAMQSIVDYLEVAYYYDPFAGIWVGILYDTILEPGMVLSIKVSEDCIWTF